jgi:isoquinoline 1-oxidoreductase alpha subunit
MTLADPYFLAALQTSKTRVVAIDLGRTTTIAWIASAHSSSAARFSASYLPSEVVSGTCAMAHGVVESVVKGASVGEAFRHVRAVRLTRSWNAPRRALRCWKLERSPIAVEEIAPMTYLFVNGERHEVDVEDETPLLWVLREQLGLTGTKYGCGIAICGACLVHIDGKPVYSCIRPVGSLGPEQNIVTIEGLSPDGSHPMQLAWNELDVPQCGYCQPGMIMAAAALLERKPHPSDADIDAEITNICRCGTYNRVRQGIHLAAARKSGGGGGK